MTREEEIRSKLPEMRITADGFISAFPLNRIDDIDYLLNALTVERDVSKDLLRKGQSINEKNEHLFKENQRLLEAMTMIRARLGDFGVSWNDREREIDEIARQAIEGAEQ